MMATRDCFAGLVVLAEGLQDRGVVEHLFEHLRGRLDEVSFDVEAACAGPLALAAEDVSASGGRTRGRT